MRALKLLWTLGQCCQSLFWPDMADASGWPGNQTRDPSESHVRLARLCESRTTRFSIAGVDKRTIVRTLLMTVSSQLGH